MMSPGRGQRPRLQSPAAQIEVLTFRPLLFPERDEKTRLRDKHRTTAVIPDHVVRTSDFFVEWHL